MDLRRLGSLLVPASVAFAAFVQVRAIGTLVDTAATPASIAPFAEARAAGGAPRPADARLARAMFEPRRHIDHVTGGLEDDVGTASGPWAAPPSALP